MVRKSIIRNIIFSIGLLAFMQSVFAQTGSVIATVQQLPASEIMSVPMGSTTDPIQSFSVVPLVGAGAWSNSAGGPTMIQ
jgi:hypothetical protein